MEAKSTTTETTGTAQLPNLVEEWNQKVIYVKHQGNTRRRGKTIPRKTQRKNKTQFIAGKA